MHGSAPFLSLQRSAVIPYNYQLVPLVLALEKPNSRILIADDVGLGKTIEAGLIMSEKLQRGQIKRVLILTPASLKEQWKDSLDYFFHIDAKIISSFTRKEFEKELPAGANPWQYFSIVIASLDYAKAPNIKHWIQEQQWDLLVVDEAHLCARPHGSNTSKRQMQRYELIRDLGRRISNVLFLTATPHNGYSDSFASILEILNPDIVEYENNNVKFNKKEARFNVCQRNRSKLEAWYKEQGKKSPFPKRDQEELLIKPEGKFNQLLEGIERYGDRLISEGEKGSKKDFNIASWISFHLQKRVISSPYALACSLQNRLKALKESSDNSKNIEEAEALGDYVYDLFSQQERLNEDMAISILDKQRVSSPEEETLKQLLELARSIKPSQDQKLQSLLEYALPELFKYDKKVIIFTKYKDTLDYLQKHLSKKESVLTIHGGFSLNKRQEIFIQFDRMKRGILLATDAISEGLNLQRLSSCIIHYELPWNPNRLEQRNGRVDRIGQEKEFVRIRTLVLEKSLDEEILRLLLRKSETIRGDRGYSAAYFGDENSLKELYQQAQNGRRKKRQVAENQLDIFGSSGIGATQRAMSKSFQSEENDKARLKKIEEETFYDSLDIELPEIDRRIRETVEVIGSKEDVENFVRIGLVQYHSRLQERKDGFYDIVLNENRLVIPRYGEKIQKVTFDPELGLQHPGSIVLEIGHPIVRKLIEVVKSDFFQKCGLYGRTAYHFSGQIDNVIFIYHVLVRFTVGLREKRVIEELISFGIDPLTEKPWDGDLVKLGPIQTTKIRTSEEVQEMVEEALSSDLWETVRDMEIEKRKLYLIEERMELYKKIVADSASTQQPDWLNNLIHLEEAGKDLLAVTIVFPKM